MFSAGVTLLLICAATFGLMHLTPGGPLAALGGAHGKAPPEAVRELTARFLLDRPVYVQFGAWLRACLHGNFGYSTISGARVADVIGARVGPSLELFAAVCIVSVAIAWILGLFLAKHEGSPLDRVVLSVTGVAQGIPAFWIGVLLVYLVIKTAGPTGPVLPIAGNTDYGSTDPGIIDALRHLVLPTVAGATVFTSYYIRVVRAMAVAALQEDYVQLARAKGLSEFRVITVHVGKNLIGPMLGLIGADLPEILIGLVAVEVVFSWPGLGQLLESSAARHDYPVVLALTLLGGTVAIGSMRLSRLLADGIGAGRRTVTGSTPAGRTS